MLDINKIIDLNNTIIDINNKIEEINEKLDNIINSINIQYIKITFTNSKNISYTNSINSISTFPSGNYY